MPGMRPRMRMMRAALDQVEDPAQRQGLLMAMASEDKRWGQSQGDRELQGQGFTGSATGEVERAPWRGLYDMPGNYEMDQRIANSLAEDAALRTGLANKYSYEEGGPVAAQFSRKGIPWMANASSMMQDNDEVYLSGPPDMDRMLLHRQNAGMWDPSGERAFTKSEVEQIQKMLKRGGSGMRGMIERRYGDRPFFNEIFGGK